MFLGGLYSALSQTGDKPLRVELETLKDAEDYQSMPVGAHGVYVIYQSAEVGADSLAWTFIHYDTNLQKINTSQLVLKRNFEIAGMDFYQQHLLLLMQEHVTFKKADVRCFAITIDVVSEEFEVFSLGEMINSTVREVKLLDNSASVFVVSGEKEKQELLYFADFTMPSLSQWVPSPGQAYSLFGLTTRDTLRKQLLFTVLQNQMVDLYITDFQGNIITSVPYPVVVDYFYENVQLSVVDTDTYLIIGTYTTSAIRFSTNISSGVYTLLYKNGLFNEPQFFDYTAIKNGGVSDARTTKPGVSLSNFHLLPSPVFTDGKSFLFLTEVYYPEYTTTTQYSHYDPLYGSYTPNTVNTFVGYHYVNANITTFDTVGNLIWNYYFPFGNLISMHLMQRLTAHFMDDNLLLFYPFNFYIHSLLLHRDEPIVPTSVMALETLYGGDNVEYSRNARIEPWVGNHFICTGYQYIRGRSKSAKSRRYVYYINRLDYK
jgi:hypothetical protein